MAYAQLAGVGASRSTGGGTEVTSTTATARTDNLDEESYKL